MEVEVEDRLAGALAVVGDEPEVGETAFRRARRRALGERAQEPRVRRPDVRELLDVPAGDDEDVSRRLRGDVLEREDRLVLIDLLRRDLAGDDPAEDAVGHGAPSYETRPTEAPSAFSFSSIRT
jgi:hypothetical protein